MSNDNPNTNTLSPMELADVGQRVSRVRAHLKRSTSAWLSIAQEVYSAKTKLTQIAYERFTLDCGFTHAVADKLQKIGACDVLHTDESLPLVSSVEGWTVLYELSKLETKQILSLLEMVANDNDVRLTREVVQNFANSKPLDAKRLVVASIEMEDSYLESLSIEQFNEMKNRIAHLTAELVRISAGFRVKSREKTVSVIQGQAASNSASMIVQSTASKAA